MALREAGKLARPGVAGKLEGVRREEQFEIEPFGSQLSRSRFVSDVDKEIGCTP